MEFISANIIQAIFLSLLTAVVVLLIVILRNFRGATKTVAPMQQKEKEPEENDERFATGESTLFAVSQKCPMKVQYNCGDRSLFSA